MRTGAARVTAAIYRDVDGIEEMRAAVAKLDFVRSKSKRVIW